MKKLSKVFVYFLFSVSMLAIPINSLSASDMTSGHTDVKNYQELYQALMNVNINEISFKNNITLANTSPLNIPKRDLIINGNNFSLTEANSLESRIQIRGNSKLVINDLTTYGRNKYGTFSAFVGVEKINLKITFNNYQYYGPQLIYNPYGSTVFKGNTEVNLQKQTTGVAHEIEEVGEVNVLEFASNSNFNVHASNSTDGINKSVFWFRGDSKELLIHNNVKMNVDYQNAFSLFYQYDEKELTIGENSQLNIKTENILYGSFNFSRVVLRKGATLEFTASKNAGSLHSSGDIILEEQAKLLLSVGGEEAPLSLKNNGKIMVNKDAVLKLERATGTGLFEDETLGYQVNIIDYATVKSKQNDYLLQWNKVKGNVQSINNITKVVSENATIDEQLNLSESNYFEINIVDSTNLIEKTLTYEKGVTKTKDQFYQDLQVATLGDLTFESDYDETWIKTVGNYNAIVRVNNVVNRTSEFMLVHLNVIDTTAPIISVYSSVDVSGITYYPTAQRMNEEFIADIGAKTDDGSAVITNFNDVVEITEIGTYLVTLDAVDEWGNKAIPKTISVHVKPLTAHTNYVLLADSFVTNASTIQNVRNNQDLNNLLLSLSDAMVIETYSNSRMQQGLSAEIDGTVILEKESIVENTEGVVSNSGTVDYQEEQKYKYIDVNNATINSTQQNEGKYNNFSFGKQVMIISCIIAFVAITIMVVYFFIKRNKN